MKKSLLLIILLFISGIIFAQENNSRLNVKSLKLISNDTEASRTRKKDPNGENCALIKIQTPNMDEADRDKLQFSADLGTFTYPEKAVGEIKLFLTEGCKTLVIMHPDYGKFNYPMPIKVEGFRTYEMVLEADKSVVAEKKISISNNYVIVKVTPKDANITIDGNYCLNGKASISVDESHKLVVTHNLYHSYEEKIYASATEKMTYEVNLYPAFGWLEIDSEPESGATVFINGLKKGVTPFKSDTLKSGEYEVELHKDMFAIEKKTVKVIDNNVATIAIPMVRTSNYVKINTTPENANVTIDGKLVDGGKALLNIGDPHDIVVSSDLYHDYKGVVYAMANEVKQFDIKLEPAFGWMKINSEPETGATILVNGERVGVTPFMSNKMASGEYEITFLKEMYESLTEHIMIQDNKTTEKSFKMKPSFADVSLVTDSNSEIYVDNELKGKGKWQGRLLAGSYVVEARKASHRTSAMTFEAMAGDAKTLTISNPIPLFGALDINSEPDEATVYLDGVKIGETPMIYPDVLIGSHTLKFEKQGCAQLLKSVEVVEGEIFAVNEELQTGREISISTDHSGVHLYADGNYLGVSPLTTTLTFGNHTIKAERLSNDPNDINDPKVVEKTITVSQIGGDNSVTLSFEKENKTFTVNGVSFEMVAVKGGTFTMGATSEQGSDAESDEKPIHSVTLGDYYIGKFEVTQELWQAVMGSNPSNFKGNKNPVDEVSWKDCQEFISKLNLLTGQNFRLPTEAEWEYAARGGNKSRGYKYSGSNSINDVAWFTDNSGSKTHQVGMKSPNELGVYDMSGNVYEWCQDWYGSYGSGSHTNTKGASSGSIRVIRGGSWISDVQYCRVSYHYDYPEIRRYNYFGFRLAVSY